MIARKIPFSVYLILSLLFLATKQNQIFIKNSFLLCFQTNNTVSPNENCSEFSALERRKCESIMRDLQSLINRDDQFHIIISFFGPSVVYSSNSELYTTNCTEIFEIWVPDKVDQCVYDLPIFIQEGGHKKMVFLTKNIILRNTSSIIECSDEQDIFKFANFEVKRINKKISVTFLQNTTTKTTSTTTTKAITKILEIIKQEEVPDKIKNTTESVFERLVGAYAENIDTSESFKMIRDLILVSIAIIIIIVKSKNKFQDIAFFVKKCYYQEESCDAEFQRNQLKEHIDVNHLKQDLTQSNQPEEEKLQICYQQEEKKIVISMEETDTTDFPHKSPEKLKKTKRSNAPKNQPRLEINKSITDSPKNIRVLRSMVK